MEKISLKLFEFYNLDAELNGLTNQQTGEKIASGLIQEKLSLVTKYWLTELGKKVAAEKGDAGYAARKEGSETRAAAWIQGEWKEFFAAAKKKSDLADALCMCLDYKLISG